MPGHFPPRFMTSSKPLRGVCLILAAVFFFALLDATTKQLAKTYPVTFIAWARYLLHGLLMAVILGPRMGRRLVLTARPGLNVLRSLMLVGTTCFAIAAFRTMPLAETSSVINISPLLVALLAGPWLGEKVDRGHWLASAAGFLGVLLIALPAGHGAPQFNALGLGFALLAAVSNTFYQMFTRQLSATENTLTMLFYSALVGFFAMTLTLPWAGPIHAPQGNEAWLIAATGVLGALGHFLLTASFRYAPASVISPFLYVQLAWATLLGWLFFDHLPPWSAAAGMVIIAASGLWLALRPRPRVAV